MLAFAALALTVAAAGVGEPQIHRMVRLYDWASGFPWSYSAAIEQDRQGFLWIDATSGLYRFDGVRALRMGDSMGVAPGSTAAGRVIVYSRLLGTFEAGPFGLKRLDRDAAICGRLIVAVATDGTPWRMCDGRLERLDGDQVWTQVPIAATPDDPLWLVRPGRNGRVFATSGSKVWSVEPNGQSRLLASIDHALLVVERADGSVIAGANQAPGPVTTRLFEVSGGAAHVVYEDRGSRLLSIAERGDTLWVAMDRGLQALGPGFAPRDRFSIPTVPACGPMLVDREGSLWMSTSRGLVQLPEPDVYAILPDGGGVTRDIARTRFGIWGTFWGRLAFHSEEPGRPRWIDAAAHFSTLCRDGAGRVWTAGAGGVTRLEADGSIGPGFGGSWNPERCGTGASGRRWIVAGGGKLWTVSPSDEHPRAVPIAITGDDGMNYAAESADGTLWVATGSRMCAAPAGDVVAGRSVDWRCEEISGRDVTGFETMPSGDLWAFVWDPSSMRRRAGGRWEVIPGFERLNVKWINAIHPSPSGGVWLVGQGLVVRVEERPDLPDGWEIVEQPTAWNGLLSMNVAAIEEDADGTLWLGTDVGIERIPPEIRRRRSDPPPVALVSGSVNGAPFDSGRRVDVPYGRNRLEAHFAALTYRDTSAVRYRMRLHDDDPWSPPSADGHFNFVDLPPGAYDLGVAASLDGAAWSQSEGRLAFRVARPWYANPWILAASVAGLALTGHLSYRLKVRRRLARENQRTRIAMDLHDEVGSGLGAISVLAGIAARPELPDERRGDTLERIGAVSAELARSLGDIVWSLRTSSGFLDALWDQLVERTRPLFSSGPPKLVLEAPDPVPHESLSLVVRRNLHLIIYEALHNARRHADASVVALRLARDGGGWKLEVEDDGRGIPDEAATASTRRGLGVSAMKTRAAEMRGAVTWDRGALGGTRVTVTFRTGEG